MDSNSSKCVGLKLNVYFETVYHSKKEESHFKINLKQLNSYLLYVVSFEFFMKAQP